MKIQNQISDDQLVQLYRQGDEAALRLLVRRHHETLRRVIGHQTGEPDAVDDLVQECWYAIIPKLRSANLVMNFKAFAVTIARRKSIDWIRSKQAKRHRVEQQVEGLEIADLPTNTSERSFDMLSAIRQLPESQQLVLRMLYQERRKIKEIAELLGIQVGTVKSRLFYAREQLKSLYNLKTK